MFGLLLSGRLVDTSFRQVDASHVLIDIENVEASNHVVVFLTGQQPFPDGMGGAVYFSWPWTASSASILAGEDALDQGQQLSSATWQFLGTLSNAKPSAIFKIGRRRTTATTTGKVGNHVASRQQQQQSDALMAARFGNSLMLQQQQQQQQMSTTAQLGISMEPLTQLAGLSTEAQLTEAVPTFFEFSQKMVENLFNYTSSFAVSSTEMRSRPSETFIPFSALQQWYSNFERRLHANPYFWRT